jgi:hypothetical protein
MASTQQQQQRSPAVRLPEGWNCSFDVSAILKGPANRPLWTTEVTELAPFMTCDPKPARMQNDCGQNVYVKPFAKAPFGATVRVSLGRPDAPLTMLKYSPDPPTQAPNSTRRQLTVGGLGDDVPAMHEALKNMFMSEMKKNCKAYFGVDKLGDEGAGLKFRGFYVPASVSEDGKDMGECMFLKVEQDPDKNPTEIYDMWKDETGEWVAHPNKDYLHETDRSKIPPINPEEALSYGAQVVLICPLNVAYIIQGNLSTAMVARKIYVINRGMSAEPEVTSFEGYQVRDAFAEAVAAKGPVAAETTPEPAVATAVVAPATTPPSAPAPAPSPVPAPAAEPEPAPVVDAAPAEGGTAAAAEPSFIVVSSPFAGEVGQAGDGGGNGGPFKRPLDDDEGPTGPPAKRSRRAAG